MWLIAITVNTVALNMWAHPFISRSCLLPDRSAPHHVKTENSKYQEEKHAMPAPAQGHIFCHWSHREEPPASEKTPPAGVTEAGTGSPGAGVSTLQAAKPQAEGYKKAFQVA